MTNLNELPNSPTCMLWHRRRKCALFRGLKPTVNMTLRKKYLSPYKENVKRSSNADLIHKNLYCSFQFGSSHFAVESSVITMLEVCGVLQLSSHVCV